MNCVLFELGQLKVAEAEGAEEEDEDETLLATLELPDRILLLLEVELKKRRAPQIVGLEDDVPKLLLI